MRWLLAILFGLVALRVVLRFALPALARIRKPRNLRERIMVRYQGKDFAAWVFAWWKTGLDAMFAELPEILKTAKAPGVFLDLGCGYGLAGCLMLELFPSTRAIGVDPNPKRVAAATAVFEGRGKAFVGAAPSFEQPGFPEQFDAVLALDMIHFLSDEQLLTTLRLIRARLHAGNPLIIRSPVRDDQYDSLRKRIYASYSKLRGAFTTFRSVQQVRELIEACGFEVIDAKISGKNPELFWFITSASVSPEQQAAQDQQQHEHVQNNQSVLVHNEKLVDLLQPTDPA